MSTVAPAERTDRKRKWDAVNPDDTKDTSAATAPTTNPPRALPSQEKPFREFGINDYPGYRLAMMSVNIRTVEVRHNVVIVAKGRYIPPDQPVPSADAPDDQKKLFLKICAEREEDINEAINHIESIMARGAPGGDLIKIWADMDVSCVPYLDVTDRLQGGDGEYLKYIETETAISVTLSGRGSSPQYTGRENLHLLLKSAPTGNISKAKALSFSLVKTVQGIFDEYRRQYYGVPVPQRRQGGGRWHGRPNGPRPMPDKDAGPPTGMEGAILHDTPPPPPPAAMMGPPDAYGAPLPPPPPPGAPPMAPPTGAAASSVPDVPPPPPPG